MSRRGDQVRQLAGRLSAWASCPIRVDHLVGARWEVCWVDGPTEPAVRAAIEAAVAAGLDTLADRQLTASRTCSPQAWAVMAVRAWRDGDLARAIAADPRADRPRSRRHGDLTAADHAVLRHVEQGLEITVNPQLAGRPDDEPAVAELLAAGDRSPYAMARVLANLTHAPDPADPPELRVVAGDGRQADRRVRSGQR